MIKGVSRQIIEVVDTGSEYFERAILYICPEFCDCEKKALEKEAKKLLKEMSNPSRVKIKQKITYMALRIGIAGGVGVVLGIVLTLLTQ